LIAATAVATARTIVTSDARGFEGLPGVLVRLVGG
jgi:predicted nucleic acid-binding protein